MTRCLHPCPQEQTAPTPNDQQPANAEPDAAVPAGHGALVGAAGETTVPGMTPVEGDAVETVPAESGPPPLVNPDPVAPVHAKAGMAQAGAAPPAFERAAPSAAGAPSESPPSVPKPSASVPSDPAPSDPVPSAVPLRGRLWAGFCGVLRGWRANWRGSPLTAALVLFVGLLVLSLLMRAFGPDTDAINRLVDALIRDQGLAGMVLYVVLVGVLSCVAVPRQALSFAGGFALGALPGAALATLGTTLGCALAFGAARTFGRARIERRYGPRIAKLNRFLSRAPLLMAMLLRLFPSGNNLLFSLMGGVSRMGGGAFVGGSFLGYIPQNLIFALLGSGARVDPGWQLALGTALFVLVTACGVWGYRLYQREPEV